MQSAQFQLHTTPTLEDTHWWFAGRQRIMRDLLRQVLRQRVETRLQPSHDNRRSHG